MFDVSPDLSAIEGIRHLLTKRPFTRIIFSEEEDKQLMDLWKKYPNRWTDIAEKMGKRSPVIYKNRVKYLLERDHTPWTRERDNSLIELVRKFGTNWRIIQKFFPQFTDMFLRNRWDQILKYKVVDNYVRKLVQISSRLATQSDSESEDISGDEIDDEFYSDIEYYSDFSDYYSEANVSASEDENIRATLSIQPIY